jgi:acyl-CoA dehydrogenase
VDFAYTDKVKDLQRRVQQFIDEHVYRSENTYSEQVAAERWAQPPIMEELKKKARAAGLWNLFLPESEHGAGLTNLEYAPLCEIMRTRATWRCSPATEAESRRTGGCSRCSPGRFDRRSR